MNRSDLINRLTELHPQLTREDVVLTVQVIFNEISNTLASDGRVEIRRFGSLRLNHRNARKARNPKTGEAVHVPKKPRIYFRAGLELRDRVL
jgi:integration host factor subunit beta